MRQHGKFPKDNPDKLECLVGLATARGWEVTLVSECAPTIQAGGVLLGQRDVTGSGRAGNSFTQAPLES